jgi:anaerobic magnesium-protoporphyrin IX monomethyl ester cyclase
MTTIALVKAPATYATWFRRPVLGLSTMSAYLEQHGFNAPIFDAVYTGWSEQALIAQIEASRPDVLGLTAMTHEIAQAARIAATVKRSLGIPVVVGGSHATALPARTLTEFPAFDYAVFGEGEETLLALGQALGRGTDATALREIRGLAFREDDAVVVNAPRPWLTSEELDALPVPAFHHYYGADRRALAGKGLYYVMVTSRGCPYRCAFCMQVLGRQVRRYSPERICREIEHAIDRYGAHTIDFADEIFLFGDDRTRQTLQLMIDSGLSRRIRWTGLTRANLVSSEIIELAKESGCSRLEMGVEAGDNEILKATGKHITVEQVEEAVRIIKAHRIPLGTYYILGHPHETEATLRKTVDLAARLNTDTIHVGVMVPYPGTAIHEMASRGEGGYRLLSENWSDYDKYGGYALELRGLSHEMLASYQRRAYVLLYLRNLRILDLIRFFWSRRHAVGYFLTRKLASRGLARHERVLTDID